MSSIKTVKLEQHHCSRLNKEILVEQTYIELPGEITTPGNRSCCSVADCIGTDCKYVIGEFGKDYLS